MCLDINNENEIFVGIGGSDTYGSIYKSNDLGNTWSVLYDFDGELVSRLGITESGNVFVSKSALSFVYSEDNGVSMSLNIKAQLVNINPDPLGNPWIVNDVMPATEEEFARYF
ncbi:MAG: hypothetical protein GQ527_10825 [Bacteroidales bacterium]|nr:hypothetical protein [Bacteroidales bacterium]